LYVKANGKMPCWDDVVESHVPNYSNLLSGAGRNLFGHPALIHIRQSFLAGHLPFPGLCERCDVRKHGPLLGSLRLETMQILHIESSYLCHLSFASSFHGKTMITP